MLKKIDKYYQTLKYLKKSQMVYLVKNRLERNKKAVTAAQAPECSALPLWISALDEDAEYLERFNVEELLAGKVTLLHETGEPGGRNRGVRGQSGEGISVSEKSHLWNFNLHYLEYLIPLAAAYQKTRNSRYYDCFRNYCLRWISDHQDGTGDGWHPYTISLRLTNLWICIDGFGTILTEDQDFFRDLNNSMYAQYLHLQKKLELHLLGNHYFENLKAVLLGALYFQEPKTYEIYKRKIRREISEQILPDGVHYERSLMYHKIILEDLMRMAKAVCRADDDLYQELLETIGNMTDAMYSIEEDMGHTPLFNDAGDNVARPYESLLTALKEEFHILPVYRNTFPNAGYYCLADDKLKLVMDAGEIAPDYMPGHGHCDALSFELSYHRTPVFVNSGTGQYQGPLRSYFRSTAAHNTVTIDGEEQSQCWGEHRVARRISNISGASGRNHVKGKLLTCSGKPQMRSIGMKENRVIIRDKIKGHARAYFHLAPEYEYILQDQKVLIQKQPGSDEKKEFTDGKESRIICEIQTARSDTISICREGKLCSYAPEFGRIQNIQVLEISWEGDGTDHTICLNFV